LLEGEDSKDKKNAIGSPLWMAPEVMLKKAFNEKADVYSFGIMLWEFFTRKPPFPHHKDFEEFKNAVAVNGERPEIPAGCEASLVTLMKKCWHKDPERRPSFPRVARYLESIMVDTSISDEVGRRFWKENMIEEEAVDNPIEVVEWEDFLVFFAGFLQPLGTPLPETATPDQIRKATFNQLNEFQQRSEAHALRVAEAFKTAEEREMDWEDPAVLMKHIEWKCLHSVLVEVTKDGREIVRMTKFGEILHWFGPLEISDKGPLAPGLFLSRLRDVLKEGWFHGFISGPKATKDLLDKEPGTFMVRFSSQPGSFAVSRVTRSKQITHVRVLHEKGAYWLEGSTATFDTLTGVIKASAEKLFLRTPCPGNQYAHLFVSADKANTVSEFNYQVADYTC
jgi:serine/threonine protein kinase